MTPPDSRSTSGTFIAIVACLAGVIITSIVTPATGSDPEDIRTTGAETFTASPDRDDQTDGQTSDPSATDPLGPAGAPAPTTPAAGTPAGPRGAPTPGQVATSSPGASTTTLPLGPVRGVTDDTIRIGFAVAESGAIETVAQIGDTLGHLESVLAGWEDAGLVPVHGRRIEPVVRTFGLLNPEEQRSACVGFAQTDEVFLVMAPLVFITGAECLAREYQVPVFASAGTVPGDDWFARTHPYGFYTNMSDTRVGRNFVHWAHDNGLLQGKRIGLNYLDDPVFQEQVRTAIKDTLSELGYDVALDYPSPDGSAGLAVQRFIAADIDLALVMGGNQTGPRAAEFSRAAELQRYRPAYILSEFLSTGALAPGFAGDFDANQFDGVLAMTYYRRAEDGRFGNPPIPAPGLACERQYERYRGRQIDRFDNSNEWDALQHACDQGRAVITSLHAVGPALSTEAFIDAVETTVRDQESGEMADIGFSPTKHDGANAIKTMRWAASCECWLHHSDFRDLYVG